MVALRFHRWEEILAAPAPRPERQLHRAFWHYTRAMALTGQGKIDDARAERKQFASPRSALPATAQYLLNNSAADVLALAAATLDAQLAWASGEKVGSIREWRRAVELEARLHYDEPPAWFYPVRQSLAGALLRTGQAKEAEPIFRQALQKHPRDGRLLFGLWQSLLAQQRTDEAELVAHVPRGKTRPQSCASTICSASAGGDHALLRSALGAEIGSDNVRHFLRLFHRQEMAGVRHRDQGTARDTPGHPFGNDKQRSIGQCTSQHQHRTVDTDKLGKDIERGREGKHMGFHFGRALERNPPVRQVVGAVIDVIP